MDTGEVARTADRRDEVLAELRSATRPLTIAELAERLAVHPNTVRFHLEKLVAAGRVELGPIDRSGPGRPPQLFRVVPGMDPAGPRHYRVLAEILLRGLAESPTAVARAERAGRSWGEALADGPDADDVRGRLVALLDDLGFAPVDAEPGPDQIALTHCPFLELVEIGPGLVCQLHLGLMRGAVAAWSSGDADGMTVSALEPFAAPDRCLAHLVAA